MAPLLVAGRLVWGSLYRINAALHSCLVGKKEVLLDSVVNSALGAHCLSPAPLKED